MAAGQEDLIRKHGLCVGKIQVGAYEMELAVRMKPEYLRMTTMYARQTRKCARLFGK